MFGSKGKINMAIQKFHYAPGGTISGTVALTLKKPVKARKMSVSLIGEKITTTGEHTTRQSYGRSWGGAETYDNTGSTQIVRIFDFKLPLDGEKEYSGGREYQFEMKIPADIPGTGPQTPQGKLGQVLKVARTAAAITGVIPSRLIKFRWYLLAKLDIPHGLDISKKVDITIG